MRLRLALASSILCWGSAARACPCSDDAGGAVNLTRADETYAVAVLGTARSAHGRYAASGRYEALSSAERESSEELLLRAALRVPERVEWQAELGYAVYRLRAPGVVLAEQGIGDLALRTHLSVRDEAMPHEAPLPSLGASLLVRAPLASASGRPSSYGSGGAQLGLGAWELGIGLDASRSLWPELRLALAAEAAYRFSDNALGRERRLAPRVDAVLGLGFEPDSEFSASIALRARAAGNVELEGRELPGTSERVVTLVVGAAFAATTGVRSSITFSHEPAIDELSLGSTATSALSFGLGFAR